MGKLAVLLATLAFAQQPGPPGPAPLGTGVIVGRVIDATSNAAVASVTVALMPAGPAVSAGPAGPPRTVLTDRQGRFVFRQLPAGAYTVTTRLGSNGFSPSGFIVSGSGNPIAPYLPGGYGQRRPNGALQPIDLAEGERVTDAVVRVWQGGAVEGTVFDEANEPVVGAVVSAVRRSSDGRLLGGPTTTTDDRGTYHLGTLVPGDYVVVVPQTQVVMPNSTIDGGQAPPPSGPPVSTAGVRIGRATLTTTTSVSNAANLLVPPTATLSRQFMYQSTFHPSAVRARDARAVTVASGQTRTGLDVRLLPMPAAEVSGTVSDSGGPVRGFVVHLEPIDQDDGASALEVASATTDADGQFVFPLVPAGQYTLWSQKGALSPRGGGPGIAIPTNAAYARPSDAPGAWTTQVVTVSDQPVRGLSLVVRLPVRVSGRVEFRGTGGRPTPDQLPRLAVTLSGVDARARTPPPIGVGRVETSDLFAGIIVMPGRHIFRVPGTPAWRMEAVTVAGADVTDTPVSIGEADVTDVVVVLTDRVTEISGSVKNSRGEADPNALVVLFPANERRWPLASVQTKTFVTARTTKTGAFVLRDLVPGDYFVAAIADDDTTAWPDEAFLRRMAPLATRQILAAGDRPTVALRSGVIR
jgi:hypothetical protein